MATASFFAVVHVGVFYWVFRAVHRSSTFGGIVRHAGSSMNMIVFARTHVARVDPEPFVFGSQFFNHPLTGTTILPKPQCTR